MIIVDAFIEVIAVAVFLILGLNLLLATGYLIWCAIGYFVVFPILTIKYGVTKAWVMCNEMCGDMVWV